MIKHEWSIPIFILLLAFCGWGQRSQKRVWNKQLTNTHGMTFVLIPAGQFQMGSPESEVGRDSDESPQHPVTISKRFYLQTTEITQAQWMAVMGSNPSYSKGPELPVECVSRNDVQVFIQKLNASDPGKGYRLPTEAEWEYACRAGTSGERYGELDSVGWYSANSDFRSHPVGQKQPNVWGLYDMLGNVFEWCADLMADYPSGPVTDPTGLSSRADQMLRDGIVRGGCWQYNANYCRAADREHSPHDERYYNLGFRLVRTFP